MGTLADAHCDSCGYRSSVALGFGFSDMDGKRYLWPFACGSCSEIVTANLKAEHRGCPNCRSRRMEPLASAITASKPPWEEETPKLSCLKTSTFAQSVEASRSSSNFRDCGTDAELDRHSVLEITAVHSSAAVRHGSTFGDRPSLPAEIWAEVLEGSPRRHGDGSCSASRPGYPPWTMASSGLTHSGWQSPFRCQV